MKVLDTRDKIVGYERAIECASGADIVWVSGHFDPLLAAHTRKLAHLAQPGRKLAAVIGDPPDPLLPLSARARLVAALAQVDFVVVRAKEPGEPDAEDLRIREEFLQRVRAQCAPELRHA